MGQRIGLWGPAPETDKILHYMLQEGGHRVPQTLRDAVVARSRRDKLGEGIAVNRMTGVVKSSPAAKIIKRFEAMAEGHGDVAEKLEAQVEKLTENEKLLLEMLKEAHPNKSLARLIAESGTSAYKVMKLYAEGAIALGKVSTAIEVSRNQPLIVKDLLRNALDGEGVCQVCVGTGTVKSHTGTDRVVENEPCPRCNGLGKSFLPSEHKEFAMNKVLEIGKMVEKEPKAPMVAVQQNVSVGGGGAFMEKILNASDKVLYGQGQKQETVDAEIVNIKDSSVLPEGNQ